MTRFIRLSVLAAATTALMACGGSGAKIGGGKQGAAQALFEAGQPASEQSRSSMLRALISGADTISGEEKVSCTHGGSVKMKVDLSSILDPNQGDEISFKYDLEYDGCNEDGVNEFNGKMKMEFKLATDTMGSAHVQLKFKGKIEINGEIDDYLDADVTETVSVDFSGKGSGSVTVKLDGKIATSAESYTYANESITFTAGGELPKADDSGNS